MKAYVDTGGNVNASTTVRGIVEEATLAEVTAGTATGATGARLFMNPSTASPVFGVKSVTAGATIDGATLPVPVYQNKSDGRFYACDANDNTAYKYLGFAVSNGTAATAMIVQFAGIVAGFSGLSFGEKYYVSDTVGTISTSPGTQEILVGIAISATEVMIQKGIARAAGDGSSLGTASGSQAVTTGFRPSRITILASIAVTAGGEKASLSLTWVNNTVYGLSYLDEATGPVVENNARLYSGQTANYMTFSITSVTDTGFTITWTETGTFAPTASLFTWTAEGQL